MAAEYTNDRDDVSSSDSIVDTPCQPCSGSDKSCQAYFFCVECQDYLCHDCTSHHRVLKITCGHNLMTLEEKKKNPKAAVRDICKEKCSVHTNKTVKYFCATHSHLGCTVCAITDHKQCPDVKHIPSIAQQIENDEEFIQFTGKLEVLDIVAKDIISTMSTCVGKMDMATKLKDSIEMVRYNLNNALDEIEKEMTPKVETIQVVQKAKLDKFSSACQTVSSEVHVVQNKTEQLIKSGQYCDAYVYVKKNTTQLHQYAESIENASIDSMKLAEFKQSTRYSEPEAFGELVIKNERIDIGPILEKLSIFNLLKKKKLDGPTMATMLSVDDRVERGIAWKLDNQVYGDPWQPSEIPEKLKIPPSAAQAAQSPEVHPSMPEIQPFAMSGFYTNVHGQGPIGVHGPGLTLPPGFLNYQTTYRSGPHQQNDSQQPFSHLQNDSQQPFSQDRKPFVRTNSDKKKTPRKSMFTTQQ